MLHFAPFFYGAQLSITSEHAAPVFAILVFAVMAALPRLLVWLLQDPHE